MAKTRKAIKGKSTKGKTKHTVRKGATAGNTFKLSARMMKQLQSKAQEKGVKFNSAFINKALEKGAGI